MPIDKNWRSYFCSNHNFAEKSKLQLLSKLLTFGSDVVGRKKSNDPKKVDINFFSSMSRFQRPLFISTSIKNCFLRTAGTFFRRSRRKSGEKLRESETENFRRTVEVAPKKVDSAKPRFLLNPLSWKASFLLTYLSEATTLTRAWASLTLSLSFSSSLSLTLSCRPITPHSKKPDCNKVKRLFFVWC